MISVTVSVVSAVAAITAAAFAAVQSRAAVRAVRAAEDQAASARVAAQAAVESAEAAKRQIEHEEARADRDPIPDFAVEVGAVEQSAEASFERNSPSGPRPEFINVAVRRVRLIPRGGPVRMEVGVSISAYSPSASGLRFRRGSPQLFNLSVGEDMTVELVASSPAWVCGVECELILSVADTGSAQRQTWQIRKNVFMPPPEIG